MKNLFKTLLVVAVVATLATACKKAEDHGAEGGHSTNETTQQNGVAVESTTPAGDTVTTPSDTTSQPAVSTTQPEQKN